MEKQNKPIWDMDKLEENANIFITEERSNVKLITFLNQEFMKKGLRENIPNMLFQNEIAWTELTRDEEVAFLIGGYNYFKGLKTGNKLEEEHIKNIKPSLYFYNTVISENELLQPKIEEKDEWITFKDVQMLNDREFQTYKRGSELSKMRNDGNISYLQGFQRASKVEILPNGEMVYKQNYNKNGIKELEEGFANDDLLITQITFTIIQWEGKTPIIDYNPNTRVLKFKPVRDENSPNYAFINIADGAHRMNSVINTYEKDNSKDRILSVALKIETPEVVKKYISDTFKQNSTDKMYVDSMSNTKDNLYVDNIINNCIFKQRCARTAKEEKIKEMYASFSLIKETIKLLGVELKNEFMFKMESEKIGKLIQGMIELIRDGLSLDDKQLKNTTCFLDKEMCIGYVTLAYHLKDKSNETIFSTVMYLANNQDKIKEILKEKNTKNIINKFKNIIEVIK